MAKLSKAQIREIFAKVREGTANSLEKRLANELYLHAVRKSYVLYCQKVQPNDTWFPFQIYIMQRVDEALKKGSGFLILELPPQHGKTTIGSTLLVPYIHGRYPDKKVILAAYGGDRAKSNAKLISDTMALDTYKEIFPTRLRKTWEEELDDMFNEDLRQTAYNWNLSTNPRGSFLATSVGGVLTGESGDVLILDDYNKDSITAKSIIERQNTFDWFCSSLYTRKQVNTLIVVFATRWHSDDLIGRLKAKQKEDPDTFNFDVVTFSAIQTEEGTKNPYDPRLYGEPLWPDKMKDYLFQMSLSEANFMALYQQTPVTEQGVMFDRSHLVEYDVMPERFDQIVVGIDTSYKAKSDESDDCAMVVLGRINKDWYLIEYISRRMTFIVTLKTALELCNKYNCRTVVVEEKANGVALIEMMQMEMPGINLIGCDMGPMSKRAKAEMTTPIFASGCFHIPSKTMYPTVDKYLNQFLQFTGDKGGKDDLVDATIIVLLKLGELEYRIPKDISLTVSSNTSRLIKGNPLGKKASNPYPTNGKRHSILNAASAKTYVSSLLRR